MFIYKTINNKIYIGKQYTNNVKYLKRIKYKNIIIKYYENTNA